jgi:hypothetical protein
MVIGEKIIWLIYIRTKKPNDPQAYLDKLLLQSPLFNCTKSHEEFEMHKEMLIDEGGIYWNQGYVAEYCPVCEKPTEYEFILNYFPVCPICLRVIGDQI